VTDSGVLQKDTELSALGESEGELAPPKAAVGPSKADASPKVTRVEDTQANKPGPEITFEKVVHDFGEVGPGTKKIGEFRFTNTGDGLLKITRIDRCCGFVARLTKKEYAPGESGTLTAEYNAGSRPGIMKRQLVVHSNDKERPEVALTVQAKIVERLSYEPKRLSLLLGDKNAGCPKITLTSLDGKRFSIRKFKSTANSITAEYNSSVESAQFVLQPKVNLEKLQRGMNGLVEISLTHPECEKIAIPFNVLGRFSIRPTQIVVLDAEPQKAVVRKVWVRNNYGEDFEVESASSKNESVKVLSQQKTREGYQFELEITPPARESKRKVFTDVFSVNIKGGGKLTALCRGFYSEKTAFLTLLDEGQKAFMDWTENYFASFLNRDEYVGLSNPTKQELEQMWIKSLEGRQSERFYDAINCLAAIRSAKAVRALLNVATDQEHKDHRARWMAVRALGIVGDKSVVPELIHLVYHYHQNVRFWSQISLVRLTGVNFGYDWQKWGQWWDKEKGEPPFSWERITWTTTADWADENKQKEKDKAFLDRLKDQRSGGSTTSTETYIVSFEPLGPFEPRTARELLSAFSENRRDGIRTHHYRTQVRDDKLIGYICVDTETGKDAVVSMLESSEKLQLVKVNLATEKDLQKLYEMGQPPLKR